MEIPLPLLRSEAQQIPKGFQPNISGGEQQLRVVPLGKAVFLLPGAQLLHAIIIAGKIARHILVRLHLGPGGAAVKPQFLLVEPDGVLQGRSLVEQHNIHPDAHGGVVAAVGDKQREKGVLRKQELKGPLRAQAGPLQQRHQLGPQLYRLRRLGHGGTDILHVVAGVRLVEGVELDPAVVDILVVVLVQKHLSPVGHMPEIAALVAAPGVGVLIAVRQRDASALLVLRKAHVLVGDSPGALQIFLRPAEHLLRGFAGALIAEQDVLDLGHRSGPALPDLRNIQLTRNFKDVPAGLFDLLLLPDQQLVQRYPQPFPQQAPIFLPFHFDGNGQVIRRRLFFGRFAAVQLGRHALQEPGKPRHRLRQPPVLVNGKGGEKLPQADAVRLYSAPDAAQRLGAPAVFMGKQRQKPVPALFQQGDPARQIRAARLVWPAVAPDHILKMVGEAGISLQRVLRGTLDVIVQGIQEIGQVPLHQPVDRVRVRQLLHPPAQLPPRLADAGDGLLIRDKELRLKLIGPVHAVTEQCAVPVQFPVPQRQFSLFHKKSSFAKRGPRCLGPLSRCQTNSY